MTPGVEIRPIRDADWPALDRLQRECFPPTAVEAQADLQTIVRHAPDFCFLAARDGEPVAYLLAHPWIDDDLPPIQAPLPGVPPGATSVFVHDLAVSPSARGRGIARILTHRLLETAGRLGLRHGSLLAVQGSRTFWEAFGFVVRPDLTARFAPVVARWYQVDFVFMTADWSAGP